MSPPCLLDSQDEQPSTPKRHKIAQASGGVSTSASGGASAKTSGGASAKASGGASTKTDKTSSRGYSGGANSRVDPDLLSAGERTRATTDTPNASKPSYKLRDNFVWSDLGPEKISDVTPYELVEWLIGHGITLKFKPKFFLKAQTPGPWEGFVHNTTTHQPVRTMCQIKQFKEQVNINIVPPEKPSPNSTGLTIVDAVIDTYPNARTCNDLLNAYQAAHAANASQAAHAANASQAARSLHKLLELHKRYSIRKRCTICTNCSHT